MKKVLHTFTAIALALSLCLFAGCSDLDDAGEDAFNNAVEEYAAPDQSFEGTYEEIIYKPAEIEDDANFDVAIDILEEKSGHWINHVVSSRLPGEVAAAISNGTITMKLGVWEKDGWVEYDSLNFWRNDWQLIKFDCEQHYLTPFNAVADKWGNVHDFSDCLSGGSYYLKAEYNGEVYKGYFELTLPSSLAAIIESFNKTAEICFVIDVSGSMSTIVNVLKVNIKELNALLIANEIKPRYSIVLFSDYTVIGEENSTKVHMDWNENIEEVNVNMNKIKILHGGDAPEVQYDGIACMLKNIEFTKSAKKFCFLLTDASAKLINQQGYDSVEDIIDDLAANEIITSTIYLKKDYYDTMIEKTGGSKFTGTQYASKISSFITSKF